MKFLFSLRQCSIFPRHSLAKCLEYWANDLSRYSTSQVENRDIAINGIRHQRITHHTPLDNNVGNIHQKHIYSKEIYLNYKDFKLFMKLWRNVYENIQWYTTTFYGKRSDNFIYFQFPDSATYHWKETIVFSAQRHWEKTTPGFCNISSGGMNQPSYF